MDRTTKLLLAAIAAGLWVNAAGSLVRPAEADFYTLRSIDKNIALIQSDINSIYSGNCMNRRLC